MQLVALRGEFVGSVEKVGGARSLHGSIVSQPQVECRRNPG